MNVYDFDKTVFYPDSSYMFFLYCLKKYPSALLRIMPGVLGASLCYAFGAIRTKELKEKLFAFLRFLPSPAEVVSRFWDEHDAGIGEWYLKQKRPDDVIITEGKTATMRKRSGGFEPFIRMRRSRLFIPTHIQTRLWLKSRSARTL